MRLGFIISLTLHVLLMGWMVLNLHQTPEIVVPDVVPISVAIVTPSEFTRMKQGDQYTKNLESKAADKPSEEENTKEAAKPKAAPPAPAPPPPVEETPPPPPEPPKPEPAKVEPPKPEPPKPDEIAQKLAEPPPPEPAGPTPEEQAALAAKLEAERKAAEAKAKADAAAKAAELKKKLAEEKRKKDEAEKKRLAKLEADKKKFDPNKLAELLNKTPDDAAQKALLDKSNKTSGAKPTGDSKTATNLGPSAGTKEGRDSVLSAREADMLASLIDSKLRGCWRLPAGGGGSQTPIVTLSWRLKPDGTLDGEPQILQPQNNPLFTVAAEAAVRAVKSCVPFELPADKYANWRDIKSWAFDPSKML